MYQKKHINIKGFTLVELAIALMVIGLLIGGVLKGQELIQNAKVVRFTKDLNDFDSAIMIFRATYKGIPANIRNPGRVLPNCDNWCSASVPGDVRYNASDRASVSKSISFWVQLDRAGLITGIDNDFDRESHSSHKIVGPMNPFGTRYFVNQINSYGIYPDIVRMSADTLRAGNIAAIDRKMDDGEPTTGDVFVWVAERGDPNCRVTTSTAYTGDPALTCDPVITIQSLIQ